MSGVAPFILLCFRLFVCLGEGACDPARVWWAEDNLQELALSFLSVALGIEPRLEALAASTFAC